MIGLFLGLQNSGKTLSLSYFAYLYFKNGYKIYSNYNLKFPHEKLSKSLINEYTKSRKQFKKSVFCIDEIYLFFDSRNFGQKGNKIFSYFVTQSSKNDVHIFGTAQFFNTVDKRIRNNTTFKCFCDRYNKINKNYKPIQSNIRFLNKDINLFIKNSFVIRTISGFNEKMIIKNYYIDAKPIYRLFDTTELINISDD
jgi:hypothetical protein